MQLGTPRPIVRAPHTFGQTSILDNFNRADSEVLGTASGGDVWGTDPWSDNSFNTLKIASNKLTDSISGATVGAQALNGSYGPNCEMSFTLDSWSSSAFGSVMSCLLRGTVTGVNKASGYGMALGPGLFDALGGGSGHSIGISIFKVTNGDSGDRVHLKLMLVGPCVFGDSFGLSAVGSLLTAWYLPNGSAVWQAYGSVTDTTFSGAGRIGMQIEDPFTIDNLRGGTR